MKRAAILIAGDQTSSESVEALALFLCSPLGGAWQREEIIRPASCDRTGVLSAVTSARSCDFALVYFIGRGETRKFDRPWPETHVLLSSGETLTEREINPGAPRSSLILDCGGLPSRSVIVAASAKLKGLRNAPDIVDWSRATYDEALRVAEAGLVKVWATAAGGECTIEKTFSQHLIDAVVEWAATCHGVLTHSEAVEQAARAFAKVISDGKAEYRGGRRLRDFPIGVQN